MKPLAVLLILLGALACKRGENEQIREQTGGDPARGKQLVQQYGCSSCHDIPNVTGPKGMVGPPLTGIGSRQVIAGHVPNTPQNMMAYLQNPQSADPQNVMPNMGLTLDQSRDIAAFLYTLK